MPVGQLTSVGFAKELGAFAAGGTPLYFPGAQTWSPSPKNTGIPRNDFRKRLGRSPHATGGYDFSATLRPAAQPDVLFPLLAYAMGAQSAPALALGSSFMSLTGNTTAGAGTVINVNTGSVTTAGLAVGNSVSVGWNTANQETCTVTAVTASSFTCTTTKTHSTGDPCLAVSATAYASTLSFGQTLPSLILEYIRNTATGTAVDYQGVVVDTLSLGCAPGQDLQCDFGLVGATELVNSSPTTPTFSSLYPFTNEASGGSISWKGFSLAAGIALRSWKIQLNNKLDKSMRVPGSRFVNSFPVGQREVSGSLGLSFKDDSYYQDFLGAAGATSPQSPIALPALQITINSQDFADASKSIRYSLGIALPLLFIKDAPVPGKVSGPLDITLSFDAFETPGNNDDLKLSCTGVAASSY